MITIPTLLQLYNGVKSDLESQYGATISPVGKSFLNAYCAVQAAKLKIYYLVIANLQKNIFVDTADPEAIGGTLERFGRVKLGRNPFPAVAGQYSVQLNGTIGAIIPESTTFKSNDTSQNPGNLFILDNAYTMITTNDVVILRALTSGTSSALAISDTLTSTSPIARVNSGVVVTAQTVQPLDAESIEIYRQAIINSYQLSPQGGSAVDYRLWAQDAQGVAEVYPYASSGNINEIDLYIESIIADSTDGKGTPSGAMITNVESVIEFNPNSSLPILERGRRPLGVWQVNYYPVTIVTVDIVITGFTGVTPAQKVQILAAFTAAIGAMRPFVSTADILANKNDIIDNNKIIGILITSQPGAIFTSIAFKINGTTLSTYNFILGNIPYLNSITYV
jgi:hypothetical protein